MLENCRKYRYLVFLLLFAMSLSPALAQSKKDLEQKRKKVEQEIASTQKLLNETRKHKKNTLAELEILNANIDKRKTFIGELSSEINKTNSKINKLSSDINRHNSDIENLKAEYAKIIQTAYKSRDKNLVWMFLLSSKDINQAVRRLQYIRQYSEHQRNIVRQISDKKKALEEKKIGLEKEKAYKVDVLGLEKQEKAKLEKAQKSQKQLKTKLEREENTLSKQLKTKQKQKQDLNAQIQKIIQEEIKKSNLAAQSKAQTAKTGKAGTTSYALTPEEKNLSSNFESNKGKLPWPTAKGVISAKFGTYPHPVVKNVTITNNGIDILCEAKSAARAVFNGLVSNVGTIYGLKFVMIRHGEYTTVYSNLDEVYVKKGDKVSTKQNVGRIATNKEEGKTELQFQLWKGVNKQDPAIWLAK